MGITFRNVKTGQLAETDDEHPVYERSSQWERVPDADGEPKGDESPYAGLDYGELKKLSKDRETGLPHNASKAAILAALAEQDEQAVPDADGEPKG